MAVRLDGVPDKNHIVFKHNNIYYNKNLKGDDIQNVFKKNLMDVFMSQFEENIGRVGYDDIVYISVMSNSDNVIQNLPINLTGLFVMSSVCTSLVLSENVKRTIQSIHLDKTNVNVFPNIDGCNQLKQLKILHSNLNSFNIDYELPKSLGELILSGNMITNAHFSYDRLNELINYNRFCKISLSDNHLKYDLFPPNISQRCSLIRQDTYKHYPIRLANVNQENIGNLVHAMLDGNQQIMPQRSTILSSQSVHLTSINTSVNNSIQNIIKYINDNYLIVKVIDVNNLAEDVELINFVNRSLKNNVGFIGQNYLSCVTKNSITQLTYKETFELIWTVILHLASSNKFERNDLYERLAQEINDSNGFCFTGKYNRLINSLVGILDCVQIGISKSEEIQLEFERLLSKIKGDENPDEFSNIVCEARNIVQDSHEKNVWITALYDYAPDPVEFVYENKLFLRTWDDLLIQKIDGEDIIIGSVINEAVVLFILL